MVAVTQETLVNEAYVELVVVLCDVVPSIQDVGGAENIEALATIINFNGNF